MRFSFLDRLLGRQLEEEVQNLRREVVALRQQGERARKRASRTNPGHEPLLVIARALRDATSVESFAQSAVAAAIAGLGALRAGIIVASGEDLTILAAADVRGPLAMEALVWSRAIATVAAHEGKVVATGRAAEDERFRAHASAARHEQSVLALPLRAGQKQGCLYLESPAAGFAPMEAETMLAIADIISVALERLETEAATARRAKLEAIGLAASAITHDLRSPLATMEFALAPTRGATPDDERALDRVKKALRRARELSSGLVALATGRAGPLALGDVRLADLLEEHVALVGDELRSSEIEVALELDREAVARADRSALLRVVDNLTRNAQRAMSEGGRLVLGCAKGERPSLWVADTGPGMPPELLATLFQLTDDLATRGGLGLVLVRELVEAMGGSIAAESSPGKGTRVSVSLSR